MTNKPKDALALMRAMIRPHWDAERGEYREYDNHYAWHNPIHVPHGRPEDETVNPVLIQPVMFSHPVSEEELIERGYDLTNLPTKLDWNRYVYDGEEYEVTEWTPEHVNNEWLPELKPVRNEDVTNIFDATPGLNIPEFYQPPRFPTVPTPVPMLVSDIVQLPVEEKTFKWTGTFLTEHTETGANRKLANYGIRVVGVVEVYYPRSKKREWHYKAEVLLANGKTIAIQFTQKQKDKLVSVVKDNTRGLTCIEPMVSENYLNRVLDKIVTAAIEAADIPTYVQIREAGWCNVHGAGIYVSDDKNLGNKYEISTGIRFVRDRVYPVAIVLDKVLRLTKYPEVLYPWVGYQFLGLMFEPFAESGHAPRFVLFVNGKSGSMKTTVAKEMHACMLPKERQIAATFKSTEAGIEAVLVTYKDLVFILDDYHPAEYSMLREMDRKREIVTRFYGDGQTKVRGTATMDAPKVGATPKSLCVITGEDTSGSLSSYLRCLCLNVTEMTFANDPDSRAIITEFQKDPDLLGSFYRSFLDYVERNYTEIVNFISTRCSEWRTELSQHYPALRLVDMAAQLLTVWEIVGMWLKSSNVDKTTVEQILQDATRAIITAVSSSLEVAAEQNPSKKFMMAVNDLIASGQLKLAENIAVYREAPERWDGYWTAEWLVLEPNRLYKQVCDLLKNRKDSFIVPYNKVWSMLQSEYGIMQPDYSKGKISSYLKKESYGKRPAMAYFNYKIFKKIVEPQE